MMSELEDGNFFSEVVKTAKALGYTEPGLKDVYSPHICHHDIYMRLVVYCWSIRRKLRRYKFISRKLWYVSKI